MTVSPEKIYLIKMALLGRCGRRLRMEHSGPCSDPVSERKNVDQGGLSRQRHLPPTKSVNLEKGRKEGYPGGGPGVRRACCSSSLVPNNSSRHSNTLL